MTMLRFIDSEDNIISFNSNTLRGYKIDKGKRVDGMHTVMLYLESHAIKCYFNEDDDDLKWLNESFDMYDSPKYRKFNERIKNGND